ncbi:MAG: hypothetical protein KAJ42_13525 [Gemmatimonadetes bacterium]|nr:hypothetical protein [Gemmatimonadota bacterium]
MGDCNAGATRGLLYLAGVLAAGNDANKILIENGREHGPKIVASLWANHDPENT